MGVNQLLPPYSGQGSLSASDKMFDCDSQSPQPLVRLLISPCRFEICSRQTINWPRKKSRCAA